ncbi:MAG: carboxypeptidase-like regulatory domain-containing protein [Acidobacteriota bacterium]|nr:carboxypeptidase-like regulatory domain-containing protein [Acidobacteriota bacterium]
MRLPILLLPIGLCLPLCAQPAAGLVGGTVIDRDTNTPVRRAIVTLSTVETRPRDAVAWTDTQGRFAFGYLSAGRYQLRAQKDGYQMAFLGADNPHRPPETIALANGENRSGIVFQLHHPGSITGMVVDEEGDPISGVNVQVLAPGFQRRKRKLRPMNNAQTDAQGRYRLHDLQAGRYAVMAFSTNFSPVVKAQSEVIAGTSQQQYSYGVQYYPSADHGDSAALLTLQPGQEIAGIHFQLNARPVAALSGKVVFPTEPGPNTQVQIAFLDEDSGPGIQRMSGAGSPNFTFRMYPLPPGNYLVVAQATANGTRYRGVQRVALNGLDAPEIAISLEAGVELTGKVMVEGPGAAAQHPSFVALSPGDNLPWRTQPPRTNVGKDGSFKFASVPPGVWDIDAGPIPSGGYIKSMRLGDRDVLTEDMVVQSGMKDRLNITMGTQGASLEGDVTRGDAPAPNAPVLLYPDGKYRHVLSFSRLVNSDEKGHFEMIGVTPGAYKLYAFEELDRNSSEDPELLKPYEQLGLLLRLKEGNNDSQKLTVIHARPGVSQ